MANEPHEQKHAQIKRDFPRHRGRKRHIHLSSYQSLHKTPLSVVPKETHRGDEWEEGEADGDGRIGIYSFIRRTTEEEPQLIPGQLIVNRQVEASILRSDAEFKCTDTHRRWETNADAHGSYTPRQGETSLSAHPPPVKVTVHHQLKATGGKCQCLATVRLLPGAERSSTDAGCRR
ncbi:unnamed protein product [Pleuronectes platessa]|uniref:Uncharacterized protein n=1 Tax=Pleuronectes platessa TaxID=8262 RepID=A0A9N7VUU2_PLEPL|nr:unnamed protein product [Pleuronectes platessa]